jgi:hypothetical protein
MLQGLFVRNCRVEYGVASITSKPAKHDISLVRRGAAVAQRYSTPLVRMGVSGGFIL